MRDAAIESQTTENLRRAFLREAAVRARYVVFARIADFEGQGAVAELFRQIAEAGKVLVDGYLDLLRGIGDPLTGRPLGGTEANLAASMVDEAEVAGQLCAEYAASARQEGFHAVASWFECLSRTKRHHLEQLERSLDALDPAADR